jgi:transcriptional regulator with XRE-family HTH domain
MKTKSRHTQRFAQRSYAAGSSRAGRSVTTLLAQVEDIERGRRIKARREELHLTQPAVVDLLEEAAAALEADHPLHPDKLGKAPVTLRGYQTWERGGGIAWEKAKLLAGVLGADVRALMNGVDGQPTPDLSRDGADASVGGGLEGRITRIEDTLQEVRRGLENLHVQREGFLQLLAAQQKVLEGIAGFLGPEALRELAAKALEPSIEEARAGLAEWAHELQGSAQGPAAGGGTSETRGSQGA